IFHSSRWGEGSRCSGRVAFHTSRRNVNFAILNSWEARSGRNSPGSPMEVWIAGGRHEAAASSIYRGMSGRTFFHQHSYIYINVDGPGGPWAGKEMPKPSEKEASNKCSSVRKKEPPLPCRQSDSRERCGLSAVRSVPSSLVSSLYSQKNPLHR